MDLCVHTYTTSPNLYTVPFEILLITCIPPHTCRLHLLFPRYHYSHTSLSCLITTSTTFLNSNQLPLNINDMVKGVGRKIYSLQINRAERKGLSNISRLVWDVVSVVVYLLHHNYYHDHTFILRLTQKCLYSSQNPFFSWYHQPRINFKKTVQVNIIYYHNNSPILSIFSNNNS